MMSGSNRQNIKGKSGVEKITEVQKQQTHSVLLLKCEDCLRKEQIRVCLPFSPEYVLP